MKVTTDSCLFGAWVTSCELEGNLPKSLIMDVGTGTGLLALMYAQVFPSSFIDAIEIEKDAFEQAKENVHASPFKNIRVLNENVITTECKKKYELIICNPPFYQNEILPTNEKRKLAHHETGLTLRELMNVIKRALAPKGVFYLLLPFKRHHEVSKLISKEQIALKRMVFVKPSSDHDYFRLMMKGSFEYENEPVLQTEELSICDKSGKYTSEFHNLLRDYYLHL